MSIMDSDEGKNPMLSFHDRLLFIDSKIDQALARGEPDAIFEGLSVVEEELLSLGRSLEQEHELGKEEKKELLESLEEEISSVRRHKLQVQINTALDESRELRMQKDSKGKGRDLLESLKSYMKQAKKLHLEAILPLMEEERDLLEKELTSA